MAATTRFAQPPSKLDYNEQNMAGKWLQWPFHQPGPPPIARSCQFLASWQCRGRANGMQANMPPKPAASRIEPPLTSKGLLPLPALASWQCYSRVQHAAGRQHTTTDSNS